MLQRHKIFRHTFRTIVVWCKGSYVHVKLFFKVSSLEIVGLIALPSKAGIGVTDLPESLYTP